MKQKIKNDTHEHKSNEFFVNKMERKRKKDAFFLFVKKKI